MASAPAKEGNNHHGGSVEGVVKLVGQSQLPQEFITAGKDFEETLGRCTISDDRQRTAVVFYKEQLDMFPTTMLKAVQGLTNWLNLSSAVGGLNKSLAAMTHTGIYVPEGAGIRLSKQGSKEYMEAQRRKDRREHIEHQEDDKDE